MQNVSATAKRIAAKLSRPGEDYLRLVADEEALRSYCDFYTAGDLDCVELDLLTDCVAAQLKKGN